MDAFRNVVNRCGFKDMGYSRSKYTWCNQREGEDRMYLRLDRAFATLDWLAHFRDIKVRHLVDTTFDHCPLLLAESRVLQQRGKRRFHFEAMWTRRVDCKDIIEQVWNEGTGLNNPSGLITGLRQCVDALSNWSNSVFCQIPKKIQEKKKALSALTKDDIDRQNGAEISRVWSEINELLDEEEIWWQQRSKVQWLGKGDRSTKYFHHRASERRKKNTINDLWNEEGVWCDSKENIASATIAYFEEIYTTTHPTRVEEVTNLLPRKVTMEMNVDLIRDFTIEEVRLALNQMHPTKAPGSDGMSIIFYQKYWAIVGNDVTNMVFNVLNSDAPITDTNNINIVLVPKVKNLLE